jgi:hypothetical protein
MWDMIMYLVGWTGNMINMLNSMYIVPGVTVLTFMGGLIILGIIINQLIKRAGA